MSAIIIEQDAPEVVTVPAPEVVALPITFGSKAKASFKESWEKVWPTLLWVATPILFGVKILLTIYLAIAVRCWADPKVSLKQKCPACGVRVKHKIRWMPVYERVIHDCPRCGAQYAAPPVIELKHWRLAQVLQQEPLDTRPWVDPGAAPKS